MKSPLTKDQQSRLDKAIDWSEKQFQTAREKRIEAIRLVCGKHYASGGTEKVQPFPFLTMAMQIYMRLLAPQTPRVMMTTRNRNLKATAANFELALNQIPEEIGLDGTLKRLVQEALFSMGVVKVGIHTTGTALGHSYGEPFVDLVPIDDYFLDMSTKDIKNLDFEGNKYWVDLEEVRDEEWYDADARRALIATDVTSLNEDGSQRAEGVTIDSSVSTYRDRLWLRDIWLPREGVVLTKTVRSNILMRCVEWKGPSTGPYPKLGFGAIPGNLLPLAPVSLWRDLHELGNELYRKLSEQAKAQKSVLGFNGSDDEGVENFQKAGDGDGIKYNGGHPETLSTTGVDPKTLAFFLQNKQLGGYVAGNIDSLGGLGSNANTLGQDKLMSDAASAQLSDMANETLACVKEIFQHIAHYEWTDPVKSRLIDKPIPGVDLVLPVEWNRKSKQGQLKDYDLKMDVYSQKENSPEAQLQKLGAAVDKYVVPLAPLIQQDGGKIGVQRILAEVAKLANLPVLSEIVTFPETDQPAPGGDGSVKSQNTSREYVRKSGGGITPQGSDAQMMQMLMGSNPGGAMQ